MSAPRWLRCVRNEGYTSGGGGTPVPCMFTPGRLYKVNDPQPGEGFDHVRLLAVRDDKDCTRYIGRNPMRFITENGHGGTRFAYFEPFPPLPEVTPGVKFDRTPTEE